MGLSNREKVIKGLEGMYRCISPINHSCGDCPYQDNHVECMRRVASDAIALLKEQEPKRVVYKNDRYTGVNVSTCPKCERRVDMYYMNNYGVETKFCPYCGQGLIWDDC